jgi:hypothetical protein
VRLAGLGHTDGLPQTAVSGRIGSVARREPRNCDHVCADNRPDGRWPAGLPHCSLARRPGLRLAGVRLELQGTQCSSFWKPEQRVVAVAEDGRDVVAPAFLAGSYTTPTARWPRGSRSHCG